MATITCGDFSLDFNYREFDDCCWVQYDILFRWCDQPVINDAILRRRDEPYECWFIPWLQEILATNKADYWKTLEPGVTIALYPDDVFPPFLPSHMISAQRDREREERQRRKEAAGGKLPDDVIVMIVYIDSYYELGGSHGSPALVLHPWRCQLDKFLADLKNEYRALKLKFNMDERNRISYGDDWEPMKLD